jgi:uncharacterized RDD family membrane protein YckC
LPATLVVSGGPEAGRSVPVGAEVVVGRAVEGGAHLDLGLSDEELSRRHFTVRPVEGGVEVEDLGSLNGTYVDGRRIDGPTLVSAGARLHAGATRLVLELADPHATRMGAVPDPGATVNGARVRPVLDPEPVGPEAVRPAADVAVYAGYGRRAGAFLLDVLFLLPVTGGLNLLVLALDGSGARILLYVLAALAAPAYLCLTQCRPGERRGQTFGKQIVGIRVVPAAGGELTAGTVVLRELVARFLLLGWAGVWLFGIPAILNVLWPLWDRENAALHDRIAKTRVVEA